jgi:hypothetical protein
MRRHVVPFEVARGAHSGLALLLSLALLGASGPARAQGPMTVARRVRPALVDLRFAPERLLGGATLRITPTDPGLGAAIQRQIVGPTMTLSLPPGQYALEVSARRHQARVLLDVTPGMRPVEVQLQRRSRSYPSEFRTDRRLVNGLGAAAVIQLLAGAGVLIAGTARQSIALRRNESLLMDALVDAAAPDPGQPTGLALVEATYSTARYHRDLSRAMTLGAVGGGVMMAGLGAAIAVVPVANRTRLRAAYIEMGVGAAFAAGGATWLAFFERDRSTLRSATDPTDRVTTSDLRRVDAARVGGSMLTGLGIGMVVFPAIALLTNGIKRRRDPTARVTPYMAPGQAGLSLHGRF